MSIAMMPLEELLLLLVLLACGLRCARAGAWRRGLRPACACAPRWSSAHTGRLSTIRSPRRACAASWDCKVT